MPAMPAVAFCFCELVMMPCSMDFTLPGAIEPRLLSRVCVVECPSRPRIDTSTSSPGKIAWTP